MSSNASSKNPVISLDARRVVTAVFANKDVRDALLLGGAGLVVLGVSAGTGLIFHDFYTMPGDTCSTLLMDDSFDKKWPWELPLLAIDVIGLAVAGLGYLLDFACPLPTHAQSNLQRISS